jgi:peroxiredoxin
MTQVPVGAQAPDFELWDSEGRSYRLSEALGRGPVVLVFYKASCPTCEFTFPFIQKIVETAGRSAGWKLWGISEDEVDETRAFAGRNKLTFPLLIDEHPYAVSAAY